MATMNIFLPDPIKDWVKIQDRTDRYSNASDYVRDLIRRDQERADKFSELQRLVTEVIGKRHQNAFQGRSMECRP